jgi:hypothetical protein
MNNEPTAAPSVREPAPGAHADHGTGTLAHVTAHRGPQTTGFRRFLEFLGWVFTGFGLIPVLLRHGSKERRTEITVYATHRAFSLWLLILVGFIAGRIVHHFPSGRAPSVMGWIYVWVMLYTFVTVLFDLSTIKLLLWGGILALLWITCKYVEAIRGFSLLNHIIGHFRYLHPTLDAGFATVLSWMLLVPWIGALFYTFTNGRKRFTPNEITEWYVGEGTEMLDRSGLKFRTRYRDILETILGFGSGDVIAYDNRQQVVKRFENVLFLVFLWPKIDSLLEERMTVVDNKPDSPVEVQEAKTPGA